MSLPFELTREHYLVFDSDHNVDACQCGYPADPSDEGHGESVAHHLMAVAWHEGHLRGLVDSDLRRSHHHPTEQE